MEKIFANNMIDFLYNSPCAFIAANNIENKLKDAGFVCLNNTPKWEITKGKYYVSRNNSTIIAFIVGNEADSFRLIGSHLDSPSFVIKPNAEIKEKGCLKLNTEGYGSMILTTWLDRPLSIAGRVILKGDILKPKVKMIDFKRPLAIIPNLAIHLNREINDGYKYSKQKEMLPLVSLTGEDFREKGYLNSLIEKELDIDAKEILDYELYLYEYEKGCVMGVNEEFISCSRLDDLMMGYTSLEAFLSYAKESEHKGVKVLYLSDNEEVGSKSGQGADSSFLRDTLKRVCFSIFGDYERFYYMAENSLFISADLAHAIHPNYKEKHDETNKPILGGGVCLKYSSNQKYSTTSIGASIFKNICDEINIPYQKFVNHSDMIGGATIGSMLASQFNTNVIDMGVCILSMHSIREFTTIKDVYDCYKLFKKFYEI